MELIVPSFGLCKKFGAHENLVIIDYMRQKHANKEPFVRISWVLFALNIFNTDLDAAQSRQRRDSIKSLKGSKIESTLDDWVCSSYSSLLESMKSRLGSPPTEEVKGGSQSSVINGQCSSDRILMISRMIFVLCKLTDSFIEQVNRCKDKTEVSSTVKNVDPHMRRRSSMSIDWTSSEASSFVSVESQWLSKLQKMDFKGKYRKILEILMLFLGNPMPSNFTNLECSLCCTVGFTYVHSCAQAVVSSFTFKPLLINYNIAVDPLVDSRSYSFPILHAVAYGLHAVACEVHAKRGVVLESIWDVEDLSDLNENSTVESIMRAVVEGNLGISATSSSVSEQFRLLGELPYKYDSSLSVFIGNMKAVGISVHDITDLIVYLICLLHLGNIEPAYLNRDDDVDEVGTDYSPVRVSNMSPDARPKSRSLLTPPPFSVRKKPTWTCSTIPLELLVELLGVDMDEFFVLFKLNTIDLSRSKWQTNQKIVDSSAKLLRTILKFLYESVVDWLVKEINKTYMNLSGDLNMEKLKELGTIKDSLLIVDANWSLDKAKCGVHDFFVNYMSELLHSHLRKCVLRYHFQENNIMADDCINWDNLVHFRADNKSVIDLIQLKPNGLLYLMEISAAQGNYNDITLLDSFTRTHSVLLKDVVEEDDEELSVKVSHFRRTSNMKDQFVVTHFKGPIEYSIVGFMDTNIGVPLGILELFQYSKNEFIRKVIDARGSYVTESLSKTSSSYNVFSPNRSGSVDMSKSNLFYSQRLRAELESLSIELKDSHSEFACAISTSRNMANCWSEFNSEYVAEQLLCSGVGKSLKPIDAEYSGGSLLIADFLRNYEVLSRNKPFRNEVVPFLTGNGKVLDSSVKIDVVSQRNASFMLEDPLITNFFDVRDKKYRPIRAYKFKSGKIFWSDGGIMVMENAVKHYVLHYLTKIQHVWRLKSARHKFTRWRAAAIQCQRYYRGYVYYRCYFCIRVLIIAIQCRVREFLLARRLRREFREMRVAAIVIQRWLRKDKKRISYCRLMRLVEVATRQYAVTKLQATVRMYLKVLKYREVVLSVWRIQIAYRGFMKFKLHTCSVIAEIVRLQYLSQGIILIRDALARVVCGKLIYRQVLKLRDKYSRAQRKISALYRTFSFRQTFLVLRFSAIEIQRWFRVILTGRFLYARKIQAHIRGIMVRHRFHRTYKKIYCTCYCCVCVMGIQRVAYAACTVQSYIRRFVAVRNYEKAVRAANSLKRFFACIRAQQAFHICRMSAILIQRKFRSYFMRAAYQTYRRLVIVLQSLVRRFLSRIVRSARRIAVYSLQSFFATYLNRRRLAWFSDYYQTVLTHGTTADIIEFFAWYSEPVAKLGEKRYISDQLLNHFMSAGLVSPFFRPVRSISVLLQKFRFKNDNYCNYLHCLAKNTVVDSFAGVCLYLRRFHPDSVVQYVYVDISEGSSVLSNDFSVLRQTKRPLARTVFDSLKFEDLYARDIKGNTIVHYAMMAGGSPKPFNKVEATLFDNAQSLTEFLNVEYSRNLVFERVQELILVWLKLWADINTPGTKFYLPSSRPGSPSLTKRGRTRTSSQNPESDDFMPNLTFRDIDLDVIVSSPPSRNQSPVPSSGPLLRKKVSFMLQQNSNNHLFRRTRIPEKMLKLQRLVVGPYPLHPVLTDGFWVLKKRTYESSRWSRRYMMILSKHIGPFNKADVDDSTDVPLFVSENHECGYNLYYFKTDKKNDYSPSEVLPVDKCCIRVLTLKEVNDMDMAFSEESNVLSSLTRLMTFKNKNDASLASLSSPKIASSPKVLKRGNSLEIRQIGAGLKTKGIFVEITQSSSHSRKGLDNINISEKNAPLLLLFEDCGLFYRWLVTMLSTGAKLLSPGDFTPVSSPKSPPPSSPFKRGVSFRSMSMKSFTVSSSSRISSECLETHINSKHDLTDWLSSLNANKDSALHTYMQFQYSNYLRNCWAEDICKQLNTTNYISDKEKRRKWGMVHFTCVITYLSEIILHLRQANAELSSLSAKELADSNVYLLDVLRSANAQGDLYADLISQLDIETIEKNIEWKNLHDNPTCSGDYKFDGNGIVPEELSLEAKELITFLAAFSNYVSPAVRFKSYFTSCSNSMNIFTFNDQICDREDNSNHARKNNFRFHEVDDDKSVFADVEFNSPSKYKGSAKYMGRSAEAVLLGVQRVDSANLNMLPPFPFYSQLLLGSKNFCFAQLFVRNLISESVSFQSRDSIIEKGEVSENSSITSCTLFSNQSVPHQMLGRLCVAVYQSDRLVEEYHNIVSFDCKVSQTVVVKSQEVSDDFGVEQYVEDNGDDDTHVALNYGADGKRKPSRSALYNSFADRGSDTDEVITRTEISWNKMVNLQVPIVLDRSDVAHGDGNLVLEFSIQLDRYNKSESSLLNSTMRSDFSEGVTTTVLSGKYLLEPSPIDSGVDTLISGFHHTQVQPDNRLTEAYGLRKTFRCPFYANTEVAMIDVENGYVEEISNFVREEGVSNSNNSKNKPSKLNMTFICV